MSKPENGQDRIHREIEELLDKLDNFVPEDRLATKIRNKAKRRPDGAPGPAGRLAGRIRRVTLGQLMLAGFALTILSYLFSSPLGAASTWLIVLGLLMAGAAFVLSIARGGGSRTLGGSVEKRWRGQVIRYSTGPSAMDRIRDWFRRRHR
ncbi:MAG: hypothetical protein KGK07_05355 [Chloroflexota bacterium]|nr:hypothetical protein [Chloroflexota bacterium]